MSFYGQIIKQVNGALSAIKFKSGSSISNASEITIQGNDEWIDVNGGDTTTGPTVNITHKIQSESKPLNSITIVGQLDGNTLETLNVMVDNAGHITGKTSKGTDIIIPRFTATDEDGSGNVTIS